MPTSIAETVPTEEEIASDFTLNTFKVDLLSVQYKRVSFVPVLKTNLQVPFCLGIRGPESLRRNAPQGNTEIVNTPGLEPVIPELGDQEIK
jgi:hypothetical protein